MLLMVVGSVLTVLGIGMVALGTLQVRPVSADNKQLQEMQSQLSAIHNQLAAIAAKPAAPDQTPAPPAEPSLSPAAKKRIAEALPKLSAIINAQAAATLAKGDRALRNTGGPGMGELVGKPNAKSVMQASFKELDDSAGTTAQAITDFLLSNRLDETELRRLLGNEDIFTPIKNASLGFYSILERVQAVDGTNSELIASYRQAYLYPPLDKLRQWIDQANGRLQEEDRKLQQ